MVEFKELLGNKSIIKLLDFFIHNSSKEFSQIKVREKTKLTKATLTKWLKYLEKNEIINVKIIGVTKLYKLNDSNLIVKQLKILNTLILLNGIELLKEKYKIKIYLYGSSARGENINTSDIDLLVIGNINRDTIIRDINKIANRINKTITIQIFNHMDWINMNKKDNAFYERVEKDKIEL